jgi:hypothetical protein
MLPTDYITNKLNLSRIEDNKVVVYDPLYTSRMNHSANYAISTDYVDLNRVNSDDGLFVAVELLKDKNSKLTNSQREYLKDDLRYFESRYKNTPWREVNLSRLILLNQIKSLNL